MHSYCWVSASVVPFAFWNKTYLASINTLPVQCWSLLRKQNSSSASNFPAPWPTHWRCCLKIEQKRNLRQLGQADPGPSWLRPALDLISCRTSRIFVGTCSSQKSINQLPQCFYILQKLWMNALILVLTKRL